MSYQILLQFEHEHRMAAEAAAYAELQATLAKREQRRQEKLIRKTRAAIRREQARIRKAERETRANDWRRRMAAKHRERTSDMHAQCGIRWFASSPRDRERGTYWKTCPDCGQLLHYTNDPTAKPQECKGRKP